MYAFLMSKIENITEKLKKIGGAIATAAILAMGPVAEAQSNQTELLLGADVKVSHIKMRKFSLFNEVGFHAMPANTQYPYMYYDGDNEYNDMIEYPEPIHGTVTAPSSALSWGFGVDYNVNDKNRVTFKANVTGLKNIMDPMQYGEYGRLNFGIGYTRGFPLTEKARLEASISAFEELKSFASDENGSYFPRTGIEIGLGYKHAINTNLNLNARVAYNQGVPSMSEEGVLYHDGPNREVRASVGLEYTIPPLKKKSKASKQSPQRGRLDNGKIPCHAYPKRNVKERALPFNRPGERNK
jgi:hypothetical protein